KWRQTLFYYLPLPPARFEEQAVAGDGPPAAYHRALVRPARDRVAEILRRQQDEVRGVAGGQAVAGEAEGAGACRRGAVEGGGQLFVPAPVVAQGEQQSALQHVAVAERGPGVADAVGAAADVDAQRLQEGHRRQAVIGRGRGHEGD